MVVSLCEVLLTFRFLPQLLSADALVGAYARKYKGAAWVGCLSLLLVDSLDTLLPLVLKLAIDSISGVPTSLSVEQCAALYVAMILVQGVFRLIYRYNLGTMNVRSGHDLRTRSCLALMFSPVSESRKLPTGDVVARLNSDADTVSGMYDHGIITIVDACFYICVVPIILFSLSWELALVALFPLPAIPFVVRHYDKRIREQFRESQQHLSALSALSQESVAGARVVKAARAEEAFSTRYEKLGQGYVDASLRLAKTEAVFAPVLESIVSLSIIMVLLVGGLWAIAGTITLGTYVAFQRYTQQLLWPMQALGHAIGLYQRAAASSARLEAVLHLPAEPSGAKTSFTDKGLEIEFRNVSFRYPAAAGLSLSEVSLKINPGQRVALVGDNGSGKTTLVALLAGLYEPSAGEIYINGLEIRAWDKAALRELIAIVTQDLFVLSGTIEDNISFSGTKELSREELEFAARNAGLEAEIEAFPDRYRTIVGERGLTLSGGQRQRLSLARAISKRDAALLVLDDVFSSVDSTTERHIREKLEEAQAGRTEIVIAQRLSSVRSAENIFVFQDGRIVQQGMHQELISSPGWYRTFYEEQRLEEELEAYAESLPG